MFLTYADDYYISFRNIVKTNKWTMIFGFIETKYFI